MHESCGRRLSQCRRVVIFGAPLGEQENARYEEGTSRPTTYDSEDTNRATITCVLDYAHGVIGSQSGTINSEILFRHRRYLQTNIDKHRITTGSSKWTSGLDRLLTRIPL